MLTRPVSLLPPGAALSRWLIALAKGGGSSAAAAEIADANCRDTPVVQATLRAHHTKSAMIAPATTGDSSWAGALSQFGIGAEAWGLLQSASIFGRLAPALRRLPFRTTTAREIGAGAGSSWVDEAAPIPVTSTAFDTLRLDYRKHATIALVSKELFEFSAVAEAAVRQALIAGMARGIDDDLLNPLRPGSLTSVGTPVASTGTTALDVLSDLEALIAAIESPAESLTWIMRRTTFARVAAKLASVGLSVTATNLLGIPVIAGSTSPPQITLIDGSSVAVAYDDAIDITFTSKGAVQAVDNPSSSAAVMVSLYQSNLHALKASLGVNWQSAYFKAGSPAVAAGVASMTVPY